MKTLTIKPGCRCCFLLLIASAALTVAAGLMLFSTFMFYDDEGYVLILAAQLCRSRPALRRGLSRSTGRFPSCFYYLLHLLEVPLTHLTERVVTLLAPWSGSATLVAGLTWRATRNCVAMLAVLAATFIYLWIMVSEPGHPGGLIAVITVLIAAAGCHCLAVGRWPAWAALAGTGSAALLLTKINVGVFASLSTFSLLLLYSRNDRLRRWAPWLLAAGFAALPFLLTRALNDVPWVQTYAFVFALSAGGRCRGGRPGRRARSVARGTWLAAVAARRDRRLGGARGGFRTRHHAGRVVAGRPPRAFATSGAFQPGLPLAARRRLRGRPPLLRDFSRGRS